RHPRQRRLDRLRQRNPPPADRTGAAATAGGSMMSRVREAVITAAGRGRRPSPATRTLQKEMMPLVDRDGTTKPTIQIIVEEAIESGIGGRWRGVSPELW